MSVIDISIVVCTYNRSELLRGALESLMALRTGGRFFFEILVVDNASTDDTPEVIEEIRENSRVPLRSVREPRKGVAAARNCSAPRWPAWLRCGPAGGSATKCSWWTTTRPTPRRR